MRKFLSNLETDFYSFTGILLEGITGLIVGLVFFVIFINLIRFEKKKEIIISDVEVANEIGDEINAKINLSRSLIEMEQFDEAKRLLEDVLKENLDKKDQTIVNDLLNSMNK